MKQIFFIFLIICLNACNPEKPEITDTPAQFDVNTALTAIEETRSEFQLAIKEKRYADLSKYSTPDFEGVSPGSEDWMEYKRLREKPMGQFSYDSIRMRPKETIIVADSVAYDYGVSSVYYTNDQGESVELKDTFLVILKKDKNDGKWKIHREVASAIVK
ncbi:MAG: YybH family protein [Candidatus Cyclobacteriaceae bacterium M3_2C_046]